MICLFIFLVSFEKNNYLHNILHTNIEISPTPVDSISLLYMCISVEFWMSELVLEMWQVVNLLTKGIED